MILVNEHKDELILADVVNWSVHNVERVITWYFPRELLTVQHTINNLIFRLEHVEDSSSSNQDLFINYAVLVRSEQLDDCFTVLLMEI
jgi:hypothetical protein